MLGEGGLSPLLTSAAGVFSCLLSLLLFLVSSSLSFRIIRAPPPYRMVNAELCDYKKKSLVEDVPVPDS